MDISLIEVLHETHEPSLRNLLCHSFSLDCLYLGKRLVLLGMWQTVDVVEDVFFLWNAHSTAHFAEHVVLWLAFLIIALANGNGIQQEGMRTKCAVHVEHYALELHLA